MLRLIYLCLLIGAFTSKSFEANGQLTRHNTPLLDTKNGSQTIWGESKNDLQPCAFIEQDGAEWSVELNLNAQTNFPYRYTWLTISNRVGSKLELWQTNGAPIISTNADVLATFHLPKQTTVSEVMQSIPFRRRGMHWWYTPLYPKIKMMPFTTIWNLQSYFDISPTNDYVLRITPLIYKVETNEVTAHLVEFPPIKVKLMANGDVQKLDGK